MSRFPRAALGYLGNTTSTQRPSAGPMAWALAGYLVAQGRQVRHYHAQACYCGLQGALSATGSPARHLDAWVMSREACRRSLLDAYQEAQFVLVEGEFDASGSEAPRRYGGSLDALCRLLDLPRLVILDATQAADCRIPPRPDAVDGVLIDGILSNEQFALVQTCLEGTWGVPVVGGLPRDEGVRQALVSSPPGSVVPHAVCAHLAESFARYAEPKLLELIVDRPAIPAAGVAPVEYRKLSASDRPTIAVAYDEAFRGYFPDQLEALERGGARVIDFSPLHDEALPERTDVLLLGCGRTDRHAAELAANFCMQTSLREFARRGGRIYAEGGGCAYLGRTLRGADGYDYPMTNLLPLAAVRSENAGPPEPTELTPVGENWLFPEGRTLRAYRSRAWRMELLEPIETLHEFDGAPTLVATGNIVGGTLQVHLGAADLLPALLEPARFESPIHSVVTV